MQNLTVTFIHSKFKFSDLKPKLSQHSSHKQKVEILNVHTTSLLFSDIYKIYLSLFNSNYIFMAKQLLLYRSTARNSEMISHQIFKDRKVAHWYL